MNMKKTFTADEAMKLLQESSDGILQFSNTQTAQRTRYKKTNFGYELKVGDGKWGIVGGLADAEYELVPVVPVKIQVCKIEQAQKVTIGGVEFDVVPRADWYGGLRLKQKDRPGEERFFSQQELFFLQAEFKKESPVAPTVRKFSMHAGIPASELRPAAMTIVLHKELGDFDWNEPFEVEIKQLKR